MRRIDYDTEQYQDYARGRALTEQQLGAWISAFGAVLPERRPLAGLDVGSGTGRFTPALARAFGPVTGVEPSVRMREIAQAQSRYPGVRYLAGSAEDMPVRSGSAYCARISATIIPGPGGWSTFPAALRWTLRCFSRCTRSSRRSRRQAGALPASARLPSRPPAPAVTCSNGCACALFRSSLSSVPTSWRPASAAWSRLLPPIPAHQRPCFLSRCSRSNGSLNILAMRTWPTVSAGCNSATHCVRDLWPDERSFRLRAGSWLWVPS